MDQDVVMSSSYTPNPNYVPEPIADRTVENIADQCAGVLFAVAQAGEVPIYYSTLAAAVRTDQRNLGRPLEILSRRCVEAGVPVLSAFVVTVENHEVGPGFAEYVSKASPPKVRHDAHEWATHFVHSAASEPMDTLLHLGLDLRQRGAHIELSGSDGR